MAARFDQGNSAATMRVDRMVAGKANNGAPCERNAMEGILGAVNIRSPGWAPVAVYASLNGIQQRVLCPKRMRWRRVGGHY